MTTVSRQLKRILFTLAAALLLLYGAALLYLYTQQETLLFFPEPVGDDNRARYEDFEVRFDVNGERLSGWFLPGTETETLVYYGGNATELSERIPGLRRLGDYSLLMVNYRGYGDSSGEPSERGIKADALATLDASIRRFDLDPSQIVLIGHSLGTGVAAHVAARRDTRGLVMITPYDSVSAVARGRYPLFPVGQLIRHPFNTLSDIDQIEERTLFIKAETDAVIPHPHTDRLIDQWQSPHEVVTLPGTHNSVVSSRAFDRTVRDFIESL